MCSAKCFIYVFIHMVLEFLIFNIASLATILYSLQTIELQRKQIYTNATTQKFIHKKFACQSQWHSMYRMFVYVFIFFFFIFHLHWSWSWEQNRKWNVYQRKEMEMKMKIKRKKNNRTIAHICRQIHGVEKKTLDDEMYPIVEKMRQST